MDINDDNTLKLEMVDTEICSTNSQSGNTESVSVSVSIINEESQTKNVDNDQNVGNKKTNKNLLFICYFFGAIYYGGMEVLGAAIFNLLITQLNSSEYNISMLFIGYHISYSISCIGAAYILDKFINTHKWNAFILFLGAIANILIAYSNIISLQYILWIILGFASGQIETALNVYIYRAYEDNPDKKLNVLLIMASISNTLMPLIVQFSISYFGNYSYSLCILSFIALMFSLFAICLPTPKHDRYRSIKKELKKRESSVSPTRVFNNINSDNKCIKYILIIIFGMMLYFVSSIQSGNVTFITFYCTDYLKINANIGRYLIATYFGAQLLYRIFKVSIISMSKKAKTFIVNNTKCSTNSMLIGMIFCCLGFILWIIYPIINDNNINNNIMILILFIAFFMSGFCLSSIYPTVYELCESVQSVSGIIASFFTICLGMGDMITILLSAQLINIYGSYIQPYVTTGINIIQIITTIIMIIIYFKYKSIEHKVISVEIEKDKHNKVKQQYKKANIIDPEEQ
eukprot:120697_1